MDTKVQIVSTFHRFVSEGEGKPERKDTFPAGSTVTVSDEDAQDWIAKGLAKSVEVPRALARRDPDPAS
ncbi:MAG: hypothetical protein NTV97_31305 [Alphaproteobacteria bacterium]|nr:hypothetical protein [Alphaproteobacteria bacterium]